MPLSSSTVNLATPFPLQIALEVIPRIVGGVEKVKEITNKFQQVYAADVMEEKCDVHMMEYPIQVNDDGSVEDHPDWVTFPDQGGDVAGKESKIFPGNVTT